MPRKEQRPVNSNNDYNKNKNNNYKTLTVTTISEIQEIISHEKNIDLPT